ncbi:site-specific integrase [Paenibacillus lentus]|uniref:Site-specific integrase n=1 Tax=Paenibacillus lentus TaxID=1338368 RepID=A0A3S8RPC6_9BACL|nr:site-specific integrase [Paenibacillus lentus]AZK44806.1 site-specific integrase [Paenibacillus lentus]
MPVYKDEKRGTWYAKFNYTDWTGVIKQKLKRGFKTQREAKAYERDFLSKANAGPEMTFGHLVELYMEDCKSRLKPTTYENKEYIINLKILPYFKNLQLNAIEPATVRKWQNELLTDENNYSQTYLKTVNNQLSAIFNFAVKYYRLPSNPARICGSMGKKNADSMQFWTSEEFNKFISEVHKESARIMFEILFWTGIRSGELLALTSNDFDFVSLTISVNKNYARHQNQDLILEPKTPKSKRIITIPQFLADKVQEYISKLYDYEPHERLFTYTKHYLNHEMKRGCAKSGIKKIRIHDLRHSHASLLIELGFSPLLISERLGHENIETTLQTYSHLYPNKHSEVASRLQKLMLETTNDNSEK